MLAAEVRCRVSQMACSRPFPLLVLPSSAEERVTDLDEPVAPETRFVAAVHPLVGTRIGEQVRQLGPTLECPAVGKQ